MLGCCGPGCYRKRVGKHFYRFGPSVGWLTHLWKSASRQDHAGWRETLRHHLPADGVAIDVGAHGGQFTRLLAGLAPRGLVVAVEPSGYTRSVLRPTLWARRARNVIVVAAALGAAPGIAMLSTPLKRRGDMGYGLANLAAASAGDGDAPRIVEPVPVATLDALVEALAVRRVDLIKADIEGHEAALIDGARETLRRFRPALLLEHDGTFLARAGDSLAALWSRLLEAGYVPHRQEADGAWPRPVENGPCEGDVLWLPLSQN